MSLPLGPTVHPLNWPGKYPTPQRLRDPGFAGAGYAVGQVQYHTNPNGIRMTQAARRPPRVSPRKLPSSAPTRAEGRPTQPVSSGADRIPRAPIFVRDCLRTGTRLLSLRVTLSVDLESSDLGRIGIVRATNRAGDAVASLLLGKE